MSVILVGVDGSERSKDAAAFSRQLAVATGADVTVACVYPYDLAGRAANPAYRAALERDAAETARAVTSELAGLGGRVRTATLPRLSAAHGLQDLAASEDAAIIVVGSSHVGAAGRVLPGSTAERLLHGAPCPVAVVPKGHRTAEEEQPLHVIGVAYDASPESTAALGAAVEIARASGARLRVVHVIEDVTHSAPFLAGAASQDAIHEAIRHTTDRLDETVAELPVDMHVEGVVRVGDPVREVAAQSRDLDLLVTGSRGYGPLRAVLLGGVTGRLLRGAACPVIVVPRGVDAPLSGLFPSVDRSSA